MFRFTTVFGKRDVVERTASLTVPARSAVSTVLNGNGTPLSYTDADALANGARSFFYRARFVP